MSLVSLINRWVIGRLRKEFLIAICPKTDALHVQGNDGQETVIAWSEIRRVTVFTRDIYIPSDFRGMLVEWGKEQRVELHEDMAGWETLVQAIDRFLPGAMPSRQWLLELQASGKPILIYKKSNA